MKQIKDTNDFNTYLDMNPRSGIPCKEMEQFLEYAKSRYYDFDQVNWKSFDDKEDCEELVKEYIGESMEALLLYKEWLEKRRTQEDS